MEAPVMSAIGPAHLTISHDHLGIIYNRVSLIIQTFKSFLSVSFCVFLVSNTKYNYINQNN